MLQRVAYKSVTRQQLLRGGRIYVHLQRLTIFTVFVIFVTAFKQFSVRKHDDHDQQQLHQQLQQPDSEMRSSSSSSVCPLATFPSSSSSGFDPRCSGSGAEGNATTANSSRTIDGLEMNDCMVERLTIPPDYVADLCNKSSASASSNNNNNCTDLTCLKVLTSSQLDHYESFLKLIPAGSIQVHERAYPNLTADCSRYRREGGYVLRPLDEQSAGYPVAFNILVHTGVSQFELLLKSIYRPQNSYCVHVDNKTSADFKRAVASIAGCFENVFLAGKLESVSWASFARLQADINCMRDQLERKADWRYLINTAAQAFPLRTPEEMVAILRIYNGANDVEGIYGKRVLRGRFENEWLSVNGSMKKSGRKNPKPPHDIDIVRGSAYGVFSRDFVRFVVGDRRAADLLNWSRTTWSPDELYWSTLHHTYSNPHLKTPGGFPGYPSDKKWLAVYANWGEYKCHGHDVRGVCVNGVGDLNRLVKRKEFFVNKFHQDFQPLALTCMSAWIESRQRCRAPFDDSFYRGLNFIIKGQQQQQQEKRSN